MTTAWLPSSEEFFPLEDYDRYPNDNVYPGHSVITREDAIAPRHRRRTKDEQKQGRETTREDAE